MSRPTRRYYSNGHRNVYDYLTPCLDCGELTTTAHARRHGGQCKGCRLAEARDSRERLDAFQEGQALAELLGNRRAQAVQEQLRDERGVRS